MNHRFRKSLASLVALLLAAACTTTATAPPPPVPRGSSVFVLHNNFWMNVHHFLFDQGRRLRGARVVVVGSVEERDRWIAAVNLYRSRYDRRELLFDDELIRIKQVLSASGSDTELPAELPAEIRTALLDVAPIYRARWWNEHRDSNEVWIAAVRPRLQRSESAVLDELSRLFRGPRPAGRVPVDVTFVANWAGAYTTLEPTHITISSGDPRLQGNAALEMLMHEASHAWMAPLRKALEEEAARHGVTIPRDLSHVLLFYTVGEVTRRHLQSLGESYTPFADTAGLYRNAWERPHQVLKQHWLPYVEGRATFEDTIRNVVAAFANP